jgi:hypothetical protein
VNVSGFARLEKTAAVQAAVFLLASHMCLAEEALRRTGFVLKTARQRIIAAAHAE